MCDSPITGHAAANAVARVGGSIAPFVVSPGVDVRLIGIIMGSVSFLTCAVSLTMPETQGKALGTAHSSLSDGTASIEPPSLELGEKVPNKTKEII